jgi:hypothetical protein
MAHNKNPGAGATARGAGDEDAGKRLVSSQKPNTRKATFTAWLSRAHITCDPTGDLVGDMRADRELLALRSLGGMRTYLERCGACYGATQAAPIAWRRYRRWRS